MLMLGPCASSTLSCSPGTIYRGIRSIAKRGQQDFDSIKLPLDSRQALFLFRKSGIYLFTDATQISTSCIFYLALRWFMETPVVDTMPHSNSGPATIERG